MIDCKNCLHSGLCLHEDKAEEYIKQHKAIRDKCSLFDGEPTCNRFINKKILQEIETLKTRNKSQVEIIDNLTNRIKRDADENILDKYRKGSKPKIYTCQDKEVPRVTYKDQCEDERTITEDDVFSMTGGNDAKYFVNDKTVSQEEYEKELLEFIEKFGLPVW